jgi:hypothetical protein
MHYVAYASLLCAMLNPQAPAPKVEVMVLGIYHMHNPGADLIKTELDDHLSAKRQKELEEVVALLQKFGPTKIAVEFPHGNSKVNERYAQYRKGEYKLTANEIDQLGMRLAQKLGHEQLYPFDSAYGMDFDKMFAFAQENKDTEFLAYMAEMQRLVKEKLLDPLSKNTVRQNLLSLNDVSILKLGTSPYMRMARLGRGEEYVGADVVSGWYARNIRMYANLWRFAKPGDRILVIVGSGHAPILRQLISDTDEMKLIEPADYLK